MTRKLLIMATNNEHKLKEVRQILDYKDILIKGLEEVGAPAGTTFISRNLFFNVPARRKFLKTAQTEGSHVADLVEKIALSHPEISIRLIVNNQNKLHTSGNHNLKDIIYTIKNIFYTEKSRIYRWTFNAVFVMIYIGIMTLFRFASFVEKSKIYIFRNSHKK